MCRFLTLKDIFEIKCKICGSTDVDLMASECEECGITIDGYCNKCHSKYSYHDFKQIEENK